MTDTPDRDDGEPRSSPFGRLFGFGRRADDLDETNGASSSVNGTAASHDMRLRIAEFEAATVADVMIPRADILAVEVGTSFSDLIRTFAEEAHSRMPVYRETLDDPLGFVHIKDVMAEVASGETPPDAQPLERLLRRMLYVPASMPLTDLLVRMQGTRIHLALVVDEYGGTDGLVSLEDLVEEIVGDIEDEHDEDSPALVRRGRTVWEADARMEIEDFAAETGVDLALSDYEDEIDTLGGVAFALAGRVPVRGEVLRHPAGLDIEIMDADQRRIRRLRLRLSSAPAPELEDPA